MNPYYTTLPNEGLLLLEGPDAMTFLQGQSTCDTSTVTESQGVNGACCDVKGRVVFDFYLFQYGDNKYALRMARDLVDIAAAHLSKYIVFSNASLKPGDSQCQVAALWGTDAAQALSTINAKPQGYLASLTLGGVTVMQANEDATAFEVYLSHEVDSLWHSITQTNATDKDWQTLAIESGRARLCAATSAELLPQMLNYDISGHVNFKKGCYTGQEIVARLHYRGTPKQRLQRLECFNTAPPAPGEKIFTPGKSQAIGTVINATSQGEHCQILCALASKEITSPLALSADGETALALINLPDSITAND